MSGADARVWLWAARDPAVAAELEAVYALIADQVAARGPACWASGRCCNFAQSRHLLYVTGLEAAYTLAHLPVPLRGPDIELSRARGDCPFLEGAPGLRNLCGVHVVKPMACRVYFCDQSAQGWQQLLSERALTMIRGIHDRRAIPYLYAEWRSVLEMLVHAGAG